MSNSERSEVDRTDRVAFLLAERLRREAPCLLEGGLFMRGLGCCIDYYLLRFINFTETPGVSASALDSTSSAAPVDLFLPNLCSLLVYVALSSDMLCSDDAEDS